MCFKYVHSFLRFRPSPVPLSSGVARNYSTTTTHRIIKEEDNQSSSSNRQSVTSPKPMMPGSSDDDAYGYVSSRFRPIERDAIGARAIRVQDISDGVIGRPVSFESGSYVVYTC